jgi:hypothetical protein
MLAILVEIVQIANVDRTGEMTTGAALPAVLQPEGSVKEMLSIVSTSR